MHSVPAPLVDFGKLVTRLGSASWVHFLLGAAAAWFFFYVLRRKHWLSRKIIPGFPASSQMAREFGLSTLTCVIYGVVGWLCWIAVNKGWTHMYFQIGAHGWTWFVLSIALTVVIHDTYFYWTHRLMHLPKLFPWMHRMHHRSRNPTPWAAYAFDPLEAFVHACILPIAIFLYPIHPLAFLIFMAWQVWFNVIGHSGFEVAPPWLMDSWLGKFWNTSTNHAMHHQHFKSNYGLYFNVWDRLMGTNHRRYEERFREVTAEPNVVSRPRP